MHIIEKDRHLKNNLNSIFSKSKKKNNLSKEFNDNLRLINLFVDFREELRICNKKKDINISYAEMLEEKKTKNDLDPSILLKKSKYYLDRLQNRKKYFEDCVNPSLSGFIDITYNEEKKSEHIQLVLLPENKNKYLDNLYLKNLFYYKDTIVSKKKFDVLYCIIDDCEYYNQYIFSINKKIIINELYFIYNKGKKKINIYNAIEKYLKQLDTKNIKQITFGLGFFEEEEIIVDKNNYYKMPILDMITYAIINNKKLYSFPISIKFSKNPLLFPDFKLKIYLGIFYLFEKPKIEGFIEYDSKNDQAKEFEIEDKNGKVFIVKLDGISSLKNVNYLNRINNYASTYINDFLLYISEKSNNNINYNDANFTLNYHLPYNYRSSNGTIFVFSEIPTQCFKCVFAGKNFEVFDRNDKFIFSSSVVPDVPFDVEISGYQKYIIDNLFFLEKYKDICFKMRDNNEISFKVYFIDKKNNYEVIIVYTNKKGNIIYDKDFESKLLDINFLINYCKNILSIKINNIIYKMFPFDWKDILTSDKQDKVKTKINNNISNNKIQSNKLIPSKLNKKQMLEDELYEDEYLEEEEEEKEEDEEEEEDNYDYTNESY